MRSGSTALYLAIALVGSLTLDEVAATFRDADTVVPEHEHQLDDATPVLRASACTQGDTCTFELEFNVNGGTSDPNDATFELDRALNHVKYTVDVTPQANIGSHSRVYQVKGVALLSKGGDKSQYDGHSHEFNHCAVQLLQGLKTGEVHALLQNVNGNCPRWAEQLLVSSVASLTPVNGHSSLSEFTHEETVGEEKRKTDYKIRTLNGGSKEIEGTVHHHHGREVNGVVLVGDDTSAHILNSVSKHTSSMRTKIVGNSVEEHFVESKVRLAPAESFDPPSFGPSQHMPESLYGGAQRYTHKDLVTHVSHTLKKIKTVLTPAALTQETMSVEAYLSQAKAEGKKVIMLKDSVMPPKPKINAFSQLNGARQVAFFNRMVAKIPNTPQKLASKQVSEMMESPAAHKIYMQHLKRGSKFDLKASALLVGGLGRARPLPTETLLALAKDTKLPNYTREQALWALMQTECMHQHHLHAISALSPIAKSGSQDRLGMHTVAMQMQHILASQAVRCSKGEAAHAVQSLLENTEQLLLQSLAYEKWNNVNMALVALGNSAFERHATVVKRVLEHPALPKAVTETARHVASLIPGSLAEELAQSGTNSKAATEDIGVEYAWDTKFPADGEDGAPNPKFQAIPTFTLGVNDGDGAYASASVDAKLWDDAHTYTALKLKVHVGFSGPDAFFPVITLSTVNDRTLFTTASQSDEAWEKETDITSLSIEEKLGYCGTDVNTLNGFKAVFEVDQDLFTAPAIRFYVGPVPMSIKFKLKGILGMEAGMGFLGGGQNKPLSIYGVGDAKTTSTNVKCGNAASFNQGGLLYVMPSGAIRVDGNAGVDCAGVAEAGVGLDVAIYGAKIPMTIEWKIGGNANANCYGAKVNMEAGSGRMYLYFDSWFTNRKEWDLFEWTGIEWSYPKGDQLLGKCSVACNLPIPVPPELPDPTDTDCIVGFYPGDNYGGSNDYKYFLQSGSQTGEFVMLPEDISNAVHSVQTWGNCLSTELMDDDNGVAVGNSDNGMIYDVGGRPNLPWDLEKDVQGVNIKALAPHFEQPKPTTDWHKCCNLVMYKYNDYIGVQKKMQVCSGSTEFITSGVKVDSLELSPGCSKVWVDDDDGNVSDDNFETTKSIADLENDFTNDINKVKLYAKSGELELVDDEQTKKASLRQQTATQHSEQPSGCWKCSPGDEKANECWRAETDAPLESCMSGMVRIDRDCHCAKKREQIEEKIKTELQKEIQETCDNCGFFKTSDEEKKQCRDSCHAQPRSLDACSEDCKGEN